MSEVPEVDCPVMDGDPDPDPDGQDGPWHDAAPGHCLACGEPGSPVDYRGVTFTLCEPCIDFAQWAVMELADIGPGGLVALAARHSEGRLS